MPDTADERGLSDPFNIRTAIPASASYLADLKLRFGNLGLAAAAYNAGPKRVDRWLADTASLPQETQEYVLWISGASAESWTAPMPNLKPQPVQTRSEGDEFCAQMRAVGGGCIVLKT